MISSRSRGGNGRMKRRKIKERWKIAGKCEERDRDKRPGVPRGEFRMDEGWARFPQQYTPVCV